jgi:aminocarboxymuconate-semialdehyde decarboxylase
MDADAVAQQVVVSPTPVFFGYQHSGADATKIARIFNDLALEICAGAPQRLVPFCQVPLQVAAAACAELDRCLAAGHAGVEIGNHVGDRDPRRRGRRHVPPALRRCGAPVFVHPWDLPDSPRLRRWMAQWLGGACPPRPTCWIQAWV